MTTVHKGNEAPVVILENNKPVLYYGPTKTRETLIEHLKDTALAQITT